MEKSYDPQTIEKTIYETWEKNGYFKPIRFTRKDEMRGKSERKTGGLNWNSCTGCHANLKEREGRKRWEDISNSTKGLHTWYDTKLNEDFERAFNKADRFSRKSEYCIMLPPPNITGTLHMGHGFQQTLMDALIRYHRMRGFNTLWQPGTDHASIATQMVVERQLLAEGKSRHDIGREKFLERTWQWKEESGNTIVKQMRRLGTSVDWSREKFTMDESLCAAVNKAFIELYDQGLIYRGKRLSNWDPVLHTAISDLEVIHEEEPGSLWHIRYPIVNDSTFLIVATTRPETMLGDTAVAVHPDDKRYKKLIGKKFGCL